MVAGRDEYGGAGLVAAHRADGDLGVFGAWHFSGAGYAHATGASVVVPRDEGAFVAGDDFGASGGAAVGQLQQAAGFDDGGDPPRIHMATRSHRPEATFGRGDARGHGERSTVPVFLRLSAQTRRTQGEAFYHPSVELFRRNF